MSQVHPTNLEQTILEKNIFDKDLNIGEVKFLDI
jgi:hypothetical protein